MNAKQFIFSLLLTWPLLAVIRRALVKTAPPAPVSTHTAYEAVDAYVEQELRRLRVPGAALAIIEGDEIVHLRGFGRAGPNRPTPTAQTPFLIGSLTKAVTALAVMQLVEAGKIELDAPIQRYLPWFRVADPRASARMTVRHLLNQTSGLPTSAGEVILADFDTRPFAAQRQARALSTLVLKRPPGAAFEYSNANYSLLGLIVGAASGESYETYIQEHIFKPLGMRHTYTAKEVAQENGLAVGHQYWFGIPRAAPHVPVPRAALPCGTLASTAEDLAHLIIANLNRGRYGDVRILSADGMDEMHRGAAEYSAFGIVMEYGMGWFVSELNGMKLIWHSGTLPDFGATMAFLPAQEMGVVLLFNACHHWMNPVYADFGASVAALLTGEQPKPSPFLSVMPWMLRGQPLIPILQIAGAAATLWMLHGWRGDPARRPHGIRAWGRHVLLPLLPTLTPALTLLSLRGKRRGYVTLYMPDYAWLAKVCGSFALAWSVVHSGLVLAALKKGSSEHAT